MIVYFYNSFSFEVRQLVIVFTLTGLPNTFPCHLILLLFCYKEVEEVVPTALFQLQSKWFVSSNCYCP